MDSGSYAKDIIEVVAAHSALFYIRVNRCESLTDRIRQIEKWETVQINFKEYQLASLPFKQFFEDRNYRLVVMREKSDDPQAELRKTLTYSTMTSAGSICRVRIWNITRYT